MESQFFSLEVNRSNRLTRIFQLVFGSVCALVAIVWLVLNIGTLKTVGTFWITIVFLLSFAYFQIISGLGKGSKYIEISQYLIKVKKNSILPVREYEAADIEKIEVYPLNVKFIFRSGKKSRLRFGATYIDDIELIKDKLDEFADFNNVSFEFISEDL